jgi:hypothetical protein
MVFMNPIFSKIFSNVLLRVSHELEILLGFSVRLLYLPLDAALVLHVKEEAAESV